MTVSALSGHGLERVDGIGLVAAVGMDGSDDLPGGIFNIARVADGEVHFLHIVGSGEIAGDKVGDEDGLVGDFGFAEGLYFFLECANDGEGDAADLERTAEGGVGAAEHSSGKGHGDVGYFAVGSFVFLVEEASGERDEIAHAAILRLDAEDQHLVSVSIDGDVLAHFENNG
jgi:hypothetical protein